MSKQKEAAYEPAVRVSDNWRDNVKYTKRFSCTHPKHGGRLILADSIEEATEQYFDETGIILGLDGLTVEKLKETGLKIREQKFTAAATEVGKFPLGFLRKEDQKRYNAEERDSLKKSSRLARQAS